jgi:hypothetical protein
MGSEEKSRRCRLRSLAANRDSELKAKNGAVHPLNPFRQLGHFAKQADLW